VSMSSCDARRVLIATGGGRFLPPGTWLPVVAGGSFGRDLTQPIISLSASVLLAFTSVVQYTL